MIEVQHLKMHFGGIHAVDDVSLSIDKGQITGLIGPNGAGKTTLFNVIAGRYKPAAGRVLLDGEDITGLPPHQLFAKGLLRTFQIAHEFSTLTVRENLMMVVPAQTGESLLGAWLSPKRVREQEEQVYAIVRLNKERGYTFCMIEHDMDFVRNLCGSVIVMAEGKLLTRGTADEVMANEQVIEAYLGRGLKNKPGAAA
jgi:ABC-type branched-subunit amino acid transport system ATPase component